ncbi:hypothetical protein AVEN_263917-1 [Araneus ventricosus]|uniref:Uncharacterized protein n=1 Tax=Araneus ventricosus TaxID=182803 RepID=A0A4Y2NDT1_ARAVE|nr:hypothetical protein AVEN_263917-1 [Araneus ventricosus]
MKVWRVLHEDKLHPFHLQRVQALNERDFPQRVAFAHWFLQLSILQPQFAASVLFTFVSDGIRNMHSTHVWATVNPHATRTRCLQQKLSVNGWAVIMPGRLIGPYLLPDYLDRQKYLYQQVLPDLLRNVPSNLRSTVWFQLRIVGNYLNIAFPNR